MSETRYTEGNWQIADTTVYCLEHAGWRNGVQQFRNRFYAGVYGHSDTPKEETEANVRLIAAAPKMLEALQSILAWHANPYDDRSGSAIEELIIDVLDEALGEDWADEATAKKTTNNV